MIDEVHACINGKYHKPIKLNAAPLPGKKISIAGNPLEIRCAVRYIGENHVNLYVDLIKNDKNS